MVLASSLRLIEPLVGFVARRLGGGGGLLYFAWVVPGLVLAVAAMVMLCTHAVRLARRPRLYLTLGAVLFFGGAVGFEMISGSVLIGRGGPSLAYTVLFHVEEVTEAVGSILMLLAPVSVTRSEGKAHALPVF